MITRIREYIDYDIREYIRDCLKDTRGCDYRSIRLIYFKIVLITTTLMLRP